MLVKSKFYNIQMTIWYRYHQGVTSYFLMCRFLIIAVTITIPDSKIVLIDARILGRKCLPVVIRKQLVGHLSWVGTANPVIIDSPSSTQQPVNSPGPESWHCW